MTLTTMANGASSGLGAGFHRHELSGDRLLLEAGTASGAPPR